MGLSEKLLNLCGYEIWPPNSGDPRIKGPQPRIISKRQKEWIEKLQTSGKRKSPHHSL